MQYKSALSAAAVMAATTLAANSTSVDTDVPSSCSLDSKATATAQTDLDKLQGCKTVVGDLTISGSLGSAALANVQNIVGSLTLTNATSLSSFSADSLKTISKSLVMQDLTILTTASFGSLESVDSIQMITLPAITTFNSNLKTANNIYISDTALESVDGFSNLQSAATFNINNNKYLSKIDSSIETISDSLQFDSNGDEASVKFDNLIWANNITLRDVANASFAKLQAVNASLGFINTSLDNIDLHLLTKVGQTLTIVSNDELTDIDCSNLTAVGGGFIVANNTNLQNIDGFSKLATVGGAIDVEGNFTSLDLDSLKSVKGSAFVKTSSGNYSCSALNKLQKKGSIQGDKYVCKNGAISSSSKKSSSSSSKKSSSGASSSSASKQDKQASSDSSSSSASSTEDSSSSSASNSSSHNAAAAQFKQGSTFIGALAAVAVALI
ncbi:hypothetical protein TBLA_0I02080 [Henningerozyma blattae CBS 6284]|uniref:Receptor L-domain domain-containing protein n=1 Tax=Henningerozyma blattae (strain ATCC 34711 / CBS 6284 / DSM 70876 / NBRC 10599 / NRRL Y-10934 / UCD 77-7) TaxID=1071380 RepID=I2H914_HENB6|nr:hypothetical protein TBLA_0I02080 [Tetrapisispora blattae CBS 6284]CCH62866.1 hypothetical protein TBLA_0I02080 [Tetrapisispora blattae CBS 6284]